MIDIIGILKLSVSKNASDVHIASKKPVMIRVSGQLMVLLNESFDSDRIFKMLSSLLNEDSLAEFQQKLEYDCAISIENLARFRLHLYYQYDGISAAFRIISEEIPTLEKIKAPEVIKQLLAKTKGLILITGATGSGKSTTLAAMIHWLNQNKKGHIVTIEDPIEFVHQSQHCLISQRQLTLHTESVHSALRAALREDPDYILIGELRDLESIRLALTAAETGHLVLASMHTHSATKTIDRLIHVFDPYEQAMIRMMLSESLEAVITQQLVKQQDLTQLAAFEVLIATPAIRNLIRENKTPQMHSVIQMGRKEGMQTMQQSLEILKQASLC
ncbi:PilT/PilU family type 4a pilus ATPase [Thiotrichales bacterium 19S3-7]|nr:PilT/PilU family type 4a pilus ATPase [Thiotrichales bacterium 19S3-7]MCF6802131.1 PilT/PilU family type 4a pilus ATPase [Thiotrichales bacterium 19S3-11]